MFKISKYVDSDCENINLFQIQLENNNKVNTLGIEVNGFLNDDNYTFRFIFNDTDLLSKINIDEEVCLDDEYLLFGETMFTYNGLSYLDVFCDIDVYRIDKYNYEFNINFNCEEYNGIISFECDLNNYL